MFLKGSCTCGFTVLMFVKLEPKDVLYALGGVRDKLVEMFKF
jgi:hypothetical protein